MLVGQAGRLLLLQEMRTYIQCEDAGKSVGFELVESRDLAVASDPCGPWCVALHLSPPLAHASAVDVLNVKHSVQYQNLQDAHNLACMRRYNRLKYGMSGRSMQKINHTVVSIVSFLHIAPKGVKEVH